MEASLRQSVLCRHSDLHSGVSYSRAWERMLGGSAMLASRGNLLEA